MKAGKGVDARERDAAGADGKGAAASEESVAPLSLAEREIVRAVRAVRYGSIEIVIHESRVVQIEKREKVRVNGRG